MRSIRAMSLAALAACLCVATTAPLAAQTTPLEDAFEWQTLVNDDQLFGDGWPADFAATPDGSLVAVGSDGSAMAWHSPDGRRWSRAYLPDGTSANAQSVEAVDGQLIAVGHGLGQGLVWTSSDGIEWSGPTKVKGARFERLETSPDGLAIAGTKDAKDFTQLTVWTSPDGTDWTGSKVDRGFAVHLSDFEVTDDGTWLITGSMMDPQKEMRSKERSWLSTDGKTWERLKSPAQKTGWDQFSVRDVASTPTGLVAAVAGLNEEPRQSFGTILHSADGRTWAPVTESDEWITSLVETPDAFLGLLSPAGKKKGDSFAANTGHYLSSADGLTWSDIPADVLADHGVRAALPLPDGRVVALASTTPYGLPDTVLNLASEEWFAANPPAPEPSVEPASLPLAKTLDDLLAPTEDQTVGQSDLADIYRPQWTDTNTIETGNGKLIRTIYVPQLTTLGYAFTMCDKASYGEKGVAAKLSRQTGCLLATKLAWLTYLENQDDPGADSHFEQARLAYQLANDRLDAKSMAWLTRTLKKTLPATADDLPKKPKKTKANAKALLKSGNRNVPDERVLTAIRDAVAADTKSTAQSLEPIARGLVGYAAAVAKSGKVTHVSSTGGCLVDMWQRLDKLPKNQYMSGVAPPGPPFNSCWELTRTLWNAYKSTGVKAYKDAAYTVWQDYQARFPNARPGTDGFKGMSKWSPIR